MSAVHEMERESALMDFSPAELFAQRQKRFGYAVSFGVPVGVPPQIPLCLSGNAPTSLLATGTPGQARKHAKRLIDYCGGNGGFATCLRTSMDDARPKNLGATADFTTEYGVYA